MEAQDSDSSQCIQYEKRIYNMKQSLQTRDT